MHIQDMILLVIGREKEKRLRERTTLQKKLYFLSVLKGVDLGFHPNYYGPYSSWVAENLDILVNCGFLKEIMETFSTDRNIFGEIRRHTYSLTSDGEIVLKKISQEDEYQRWQDALEYINAQPLANNFKKLSIAAKVHYIANMKELTPKLIREITKAYGWHIRGLEIQELFLFFEALTTPPDKKVKNGEKQRQISDDKYSVPPKQLSITGLT
ncbi:MAG: hypothetical protein OXG88_05470 [Gammaproteobacteria bacterium]|nr:hypothetical protein [Gammaproteobacteria bacterium]